MGIPKITNFDINDTVPADGKTLYADPTARNAIQYPWVGMLAYVISESKWFKLDALPASSSGNWSEFVPGVPGGSSEKAIRLNLEGGQKTFEIPFDGAIDFQNISIAEAEINEIQVTARIENSNSYDYAGLHLSTTDGTTFNDESGGSGATSINNYYAAKASTDRTYLVLTVDTGAWTSETAIVVNYIQL